MPLRVYPSSDTTFHYRVDLEASLDFEMGADGRAKHVVAHGGDETDHGVRVE